MVWRNKRRFIVVMSGTIFAISIISSVFLVANYQGHEIGVTFIAGYQPPINFQTNGVMNLTEYDQLDELVMEADAFGTNVVKNVTRHFSMSSCNDVYWASSRSVIYFFTNNQTLNWTTFKYNSTNYENVYYSVMDDLHGISPSMVVAGTYPAAPKEILVTSTLATEFSIAINDTIAIGNNITQELETGFKIVGLIDKKAWEYNNFIYMTYIDFYGMVSTIAANDTIMVIPAYNALSVYTDLSSVNIYNLNDIITRISNLEARIEIGIASRGYDFDVYYTMESAGDMNMYIVIFVLTYLGLLVALLMPVILLSNYVSQTIGFEMFEKRTVEFGQFRSRGFSRVQMNKVLMSEILISATFCAAMSSAIGIGMSYLMFPFTTIFPGPSGGMGLGGPSYMPFFNIDTIIIYAIIVVVLSLLLVLSVYVQPMQRSYTREMIDSLRRNLKERLEKSQLIGGIVFMYILGIVPIVLYLLVVLVSSTVVTMVLSMYSFLITILSMFSPFFIAFATIKLLGEKMPKRFASICTAFLNRSKNQVIHVIRRNITRKAGKIAKLALIIMFTMAFGLTVKLSGRSLNNYQTERAQVTIGSDIRTAYWGNLATLDAIRDAITARPNVTSTFFMMEQQGRMTNLDEPMFMYNTFRFHLTNLSDVINTSRSTKEKFLMDTTWASLENVVGSNPDIALLPSPLKPYIHDTTISVSIYVWNDTGSVVSITKDFTIAGYFKAFPAVDPLSAGSSYFGWYDYPVILNADPSKMFQVASLENFEMTACIMTPYMDQPRIDAAAADMGLSNYITISNASGPSNPVAFNPLLENSLFYGLLDLDYWLVLFISIFGIGIVTFMKITSERKEIGLFRIRGFDNRMVYNIQLSEKYMPILIGALVGVIAGFFSGILVTTGVALNFSFFNPVIHYSIDLVFTFWDILLLIIVPILLYLLVILLAIKFELRQNLGTIMDEED